MRFRCTRASALTCIKSVTKHRQAWLAEHSTFARTSAYGASLATGPSTSLSTVIPGAQGADAGSPSCGAEGGARLSSGRARRGGGRRQAILSTHHIQRKTLDRSVPLGVREYKQRNVSTEAAGHPAQAVANPPTVANPQQFLRKESHGSSRRKRRRSKAWGREQGPACTLQHQGRTSPPHTGAGDSHIISSSCCSSRGA